MHDYVKIIFLRLTLFVPIAYRRQHKVDVKPALFRFFFGSFARKHESSYEIIIDSELDIGGKTIAEHGDFARFQPADTADAVTHYGIGLTADGKRLFAVDFSMSAR